MEKHYTHGFWAFTRNKLESTYTIIIGFKVACYDKIKRKSIEEYNKLRSSIRNVFSMRYNKNMHVHFEVILYLGDQPECHEMNYLMRDSSTF